MSRRLRFKTCLVVGISDGDTLTARCGEPSDYLQLEVRLAEIDAPEKKQAFGQRSKESLADLCFRVMATIKPRPSTATAAPWRAGMAWAYTQYLTDLEVFPAEPAARRERVGLWHDTAPVAPLEFRHRKNMHSSRIDPACEYTVHIL